MPDILTPPQNNPTTAVMVSKHNCSKKCTTLLCDPVLILFDPYVVHVTMISQASRSLLIGVEMTCVQTIVQPHIHFDLRNYNRQKVAQYP